MLRRHHGRAVTTTLKPAQIKAVPSSRVSTDTTRPEGGGSSIYEHDEFLDPVTWDLIIDPVVGSDGRTYDRYRTHPLS